VVTDLGRGGTFYGVFSNGSFMNATMTELLKCLHICKSCGRNSSRVFYESHRRRSEIVQTSTENSNYTVFYSLSFVGIAAVNNESCNIFPRS